MAVALQESVAVCGDAPNATLTGRVHVNPVEALWVRVTVPVNPLRADSVMVEVPEEPTRIWAGDTAPALIVKSTTTNVIDAVVWDSVPSVPVTVTV